VDNEDLKFINIGGWDIPKPYRDPVIRAILNKISEMEPGEAIQVELPPDRSVSVIQWAVYRQIRRHEVDASVRVKHGKLFLIKADV
jgi:hypothetical protein